MTNFDKVIGRKRPGAIPDSQEEKYVKEQKSDLDLSIEKLIVSDLKIKVSEIKFIHIEKDSPSHSAAAISGNPSDIKYYGLARQLII